MGAVAHCISAASSQSRLVYPTVLIPFDWCMPFGFRSGLQEYYWTLHVSDFQGRSGFAEVFSVSESGNCWEVGCGPVRASTKNIPRMFNCQGTKQKYKQNILSLPFPSRINSHHYLLLVLLNRTSSSKSYESGIALSIIASSTRDKAPCPPLLRVRTCRRKVRRTTSKAGLLSAFFRQPPATTCSHLTTILYPIPV